MKNFLNYFYLYRESSDVDFESASSNSVIKIPKSSQKSEAAVKFFAGENISKEEITTKGNFCYKANFSVEKEIDETEFVEAIKCGFDELGLDGEISVKKILTPTRVMRGNTSGEYEIQIKIS